MICSHCHELVEGTAFVHMSISCNVHRRCTLGFELETQSSERGPTGHAHLPPGHVPESGPK